MRLEVVGMLWGTLEFYKQARVLDLNQDGALLEYPVAVLPDSIHAVWVAHNGARINLNVRVHHVRRTTDAAGCIAYLAGVEFLSVPAGFPELLAERSAPEAGQISTTR